MANDKRHSELNPLSGLLEDYDSSHTSEWMGIPRTTPVLDRSQTIYEVNQAILAERERCAKIAEGYGWPDHIGDPQRWLDSIAAAIRSGK